MLLQCSIHVYHMCHTSLGQNIGLCRSGMPFAVRFIRTDFELHMYKVQAGCSTGSMREPGKGELCAFGQEIRIRLVPRGMAKA